MTFQTLMEIYILPIFSFGAAIIYFRYGREKLDRTTYKYIWVNDTNSKIKGALFGLMGLVLITKNAGWW